MKLERGHRKEASTDRAGDQTGRPCADNLSSCYNMIPRLRPRSQYRDTRAGTQVHGKGHFPEFHPGLSIFQSFSGNADEQTELINVYLPV